METRMKTVAAAIAVSLLAALGTAQAQTAGCRALIGIDSAVNPPVIAGPVTAWTTVADNGDSFRSRNTTDACSVKVVVTSAKGKPTSVTLDLGPMTQDECSMYKFLSSIDSKLVQGKAADAYTTAGTMLSKIDSLASTAQLIDPGYAAIRNAAVGIQSCIAVNP